MAANTAHTTHGIWLNYGETMLLHLSHIHMHLTGNESPLFKGKKKGRIFLTSHRIIFKSKKAKDPLQSFSVPLLTLFNLSIVQPIFRANYISGCVFALPYGNFQDIVQFKIIFKNGGALLYADVMLRAIKRLLQNIYFNYTPICSAGDKPPEYVSPDVENPPPTYDQCLSLFRENASSA